MLATLEIPIMISAVLLTLVAMVISKYHLPADRPMVAIRCVLPDAVPAKVRLALVKLPVLPNDGFIVNQLAATLLLSAGTSVMVS